MPILSSSFTLSNIMLFFIGILTAFLLMLLFLTLFLSSSIRKMSVRCENFAFKGLVEDKKREFYELVEEKDMGYMEAMKKINIDLISSISSYYQKDSSHPALEITIGESVQLLKYVTSLMRKALDIPGIDYFRNMRISFIYSTIRKTSMVTRHKAFRIATGSVVSEILAALKGLLHIIDPFYWIRRIVISGSINITIKSLCVSEINLFAAELDKVYSKQFMTREERLIPMLDETK